jgi:pimeloyl-ACP methyl ester carboxylesterase
MRFAAANGVRIAYDVLGNGETVVLLHDFGRSCVTWLESGALKPCLARGWRVVLIDLRGHGQSGKPADPGDYSCIECSQDVVAVLHQAGIARAALLGYGWGGRIALSVAASAPTRVHAVAAGGCHPFAECPRFGEAPSPSLKPWLNRLGGPGEAAAIVATNHMGSDEPTARAARAPCDQPDIADALARSRVPVLLFAGRKDPRYPLILSFAEQSGAQVMMLAEHDHESAAAAAAQGQLLGRLLQFLAAPESGANAEAVPPCLWSGSWA